ncbi:MAG: dihydrofolate reductase [Erysipelotrichaceae bacterium]|jgi:dihydrofolate reductase
MFSFSVAFDPKKGIGLNGILPWHIKEELQLFKKNTLHKNIVMGRTTYENLPVKLVDRNIYVVSAKEDYKPEGVTIIKDLAQFLEKYSDEETEYIICGGASVYRQAYPYCIRGYVSFIKEEYRTDTYFDCFCQGDWNIVEKVEYEKFVYCLLERRNENGINR